MNGQKKNDRPRGWTVRLSDRIAAACPVVARFAIGTAAATEGMPPAEAASTLREQAR